MTIRFSSAARNAKGQKAIDDAGAAAILRLYTTTQPATFGGSIGASVLLASIALPNPIGAMSAGVLTFGTIGNGIGIANGNVGWATVVTSGGTRVIDLSCSVSGGGGDIIMLSLAVAVDLPILMPAPQTITIGDA